MLSRRSFLGGLVGGIATAAAVRTFPFRVFSFPSEIVAPASENFLLLDQEMISEEALRILIHNLQFASVIGDSWSKDFEREFPIGKTIKIKTPHRFQLQDTFA